MFKFLRTFLTIASFVVLFEYVLPRVLLQEISERIKSNDSFEIQITEHPGGVLVNDKLIFTKSKSPYLLRNDLIVERDAEVVIEPGVTIKVEPQIGITVRGILMAEGTQDERIIFTAAENALTKTVNFPDIRLVDGPTILSGRLQIRHNGLWRSVCTNSKNWTHFDMETACRQLGFQGGSFYSWINREMPHKPRILFEQPLCSGIESTLFECKWNTRQLGSGVCDYHPDLAIQCLPLHNTPLFHWRGIRFEYAKNDKILNLQNTLYIPKSSSTLRYVNIYYGGAGRNQNTTSSLHIEGVPPNLEHLEVINSAYNGMDFINPDAPINIKNCSIRNNRGHGIFVNSSYGSIDIYGCVVNENGGDGIRYIRAEETPEEKSDRFDYHDFCQLAVASSQTFPIQLFAEQTIFQTRERECSKVFTTKYGHVLTLHFVRALTERNNSASIEVYDGSTLNNRLILKLSIKNNTRPQSLSTYSNQMFIKFRADPGTETMIFMRVMSGLKKSLDVNISNSDVSENIGRGIAVDNIRSQLHVHKSSVSKNEHVAGVHVTSGVGDVNVTECRVSFNEGDGINITYTGGSRNISRSSISSNKGYGLAVWLNNTYETEYIFVNQTTVVQYSEIYKNLDIGLLHGNYCGNALFNITGNSFTNCLNHALEILSCWKNINIPTNLQISHNKFISNERISLKIYPALNIHAHIDYNHFRQNLLGGLLIKTKPLEEFNALPNNFLIQQNYFINNSGTYVVNLALSPYAENQYLLFTKNFVKNNNIKEPFLLGGGAVSKLIPRSRVAAPIVVGSNNVEVFRNIIENPNSKYEIGSHLNDQSKIINCTYNWLGFGSDEYIFPRIFHRNDRYNLAKINFIPFLLHNSNPLTTRININQLYVPKFASIDLNKVGGEIEGEETITRGEYLVTRDISIRPGGKLTIEPGVTLRFPPSIGIMVGGKLDAHGIQPESIRFTLKEELLHPLDNTTDKLDTEQYDSETELFQLESDVPIRLIGGVTEAEGRLQLKINNEWGTVCNYGWTIRNAALVCQQLGFVLNPNDWYLERSEIPIAGITERVIASNIQCDDHDLDITQCKSERVNDFEHSCDHDNDVGIRCYKTSWAGVRFSSLAERTDIQFITIERAGLLDYATNSFKPALQLDFARQNFENIKVTENLYHGLGVMYSDIFSESVNIIRSSEFSYNKGAGIHLKQLGLNLLNNRIENNFIGIEHNPTLSGLQQRELAGWFIKNEEDSRYEPFLIPQSSDENSIDLKIGEIKYLITSKITGENISRSYKIQCDPGWVIGVQLINPIENRSSENIIILDAPLYHTSAEMWKLRRDLTLFPTTSSTHGIILDYVSGSNALGGTALVMTPVRAPVQIIPNRRVKGPIPTLNAFRTIIKNNAFGVHASYYNRYLDELGNHFLRKANETLKFVSCEISYNLYEAVFVHSPHWDLHKGNLSEITIMINKSCIADNGKGIYHFSRDMRASNNLFHYILQDNSIERNKGGGFNIALPYVWQYNENFTHSIYIDNVTWANNRNFDFTIDGHFSVVNITNNVFKENKCRTGLLAIKGMEKKLLITNNKFTNNNGEYLVQFSINSQSEIMGNMPAIFAYNELRNNNFATVERGLSMMQRKEYPTYAVGFKGIQKVDIIRNLFSDNILDYLLVAGIKTAKVNNFLNARENWWGSKIESEIDKKIFDFDDWNDHAIAVYKPYLLEDNFESSYSTTFSINTTCNLNHLGGRIYEDLTLVDRGRPYIIQSDITVMHNVTLTIKPNVVMEFAPNIGILVLGSIIARGYKNNEIIMRSLKQFGNIENTASSQSILRDKRDIETFTGQEGIRLCQSHNCVENEEGTTNEGFLEYFNTTTLQWIPMCDSRFTERNAQVICRQLGFNPLNSFFDFDIRTDFHSNSLSRIWSWPEPLQCKGTEQKYDNCPIRLNGQQFGHRYKCKWNSKFIFIHCGKEVFRRNKYWGGIRFANAEFEQLDAYKIHDIHTHSTIPHQESVLEYVKISQAGILHDEKSPAIQSIIKSPRINFVEVNGSAFHGIDLIVPSRNLYLLSNAVQNSLGIGINIVSLSGEGRESVESSFTPLKGLNIAYNLFSLVDICDTQKEIRIDERVILYYKYDNHPVNCIKIFRSGYNIKPLGLRFLQFNLFNSTASYVGIPDFIQLIDGDIYNISSVIIDTVSMTSGNSRQLFQSTYPSLTVKLFSNGASSDHGFVAEVITLPISAIGFNRDIQHNISNCVIKNNHQGGVLYSSAGEVNPIITIANNQFIGNCRKLYGNFTTCKSAIEIDIQNTQSVYFMNNLVDRNQGGLYIKADSRGSATSLRGWIHNNLFVNNSNLPTLYLEGRRSSPYQEVTIYRNYFTRNHAGFHNNIVLYQVVSNFTYNYVKRNIGLQNLEVSGFDRVRLNIYQTTTHNGFYNNYATCPNSRSTVIAGTAGQHYVDNIFFNPDNDYEMITVNKSFTLHLWNTKIDAANNYWGFNTSLAVGGRIRDQRDDPKLLEVIYKPYYMNNKTILNGKCPPGWDLVGETCYIYIGAPMTFWEAKLFCQADNASIPYLLGNFHYLPLFDFLRKQHQWYIYSDKVWIQHIDRINECTVFAYQTVEVEDCNRRGPFICEIDPKVSIRILPLTDDIVSISVLSSISLAILLIILVIGCWWSKSKYRHTQRLERRNSIRQSLHSLKSVGLPQSSFIESGYRRKPTQISNPSTDTLTKKMITNGSIDSIEKSTYSSSIEDSQSYDIYEVHNMNPSSFPYHPTTEYHKSPINLENQYGKPVNYTLAYKNEGFRDNSTFTTNSRADSIQNAFSDKIPIIHSCSGEISFPLDEYDNEETLPLQNGESGSTLDLNRITEKKNKYHINLPLEKTDTMSKTSTYLEQLDNLHYSSVIDLVHSTEDSQQSVAAGNNILPHSKTRAKSEVLLETNFDYLLSDGCPQLNQPLSDTNRSRSQPLETAM